VKSGRPLLVAGIVVYLLACAVAGAGTFAYYSQRANDAFVILLTCGVFLAVWPAVSRWTSFTRRLAGQPAFTSPVESAMERNWRGVTGGFLLASVLAAGAAAIFGLPV
jgi:predicted ribosomally synthesized peptide with SipW-like signal peptide